ncbi:MAG TPA: hypothetical protein VGW14_10165, partial [Thermoleophilaceae bacterium]|nr:hypothetical protein [Thermoleophilaceae bacterium]
GPGPAPAPGAAPAPAEPAEAPPPGGQKKIVGDAAPPRLWVRVSRRQRIERVLRRGIPVRVRCSEACSALVRLSVGRGISGSAREPAIEAGASRRMVVRIARAGRARLSAAGARRAKLTVRAVDRWGNSRTVTLRVRLGRRGVSR